jgi:hypothetical protein
LILTDREHKVVAEGFSLGELGEKMRQIRKKWERENRDG